MKIAVVNPNKVGFVLGALIAGWHVLWAHMIKPVYVIKGFDPAAAVTLVAMTSVTGYLFGFFGGILWNRLHRG